jgi:hypothetical protein
MEKMRCFLIALILLSPLATFSQPQSDSSQTIQITGVVQSFSGNILDVKPAQAPAVWATIPQDLRMDRSALKPGAEVSVEARWTVACYVASQVHVQ